MDTSILDSVLHCDDSSVDEPELQLVTFDIEETPLVDIDHVLLELDMEKFAFDDVSRIDSSTLEPEMESFMVDYGEVDSDVKEPSSTISLVATSPVEISTTTPHLVSSIEVVLKLLPNYLRYDRYFLKKTCHIMDTAYAPCNLLMISIYHMLNRYAYVIGYSIDDLEGIVPTLVLACLLSFLSGLRLYTIHCELTKFEMTSHGILVDSRHGDEEKQWAHVKKSEDGAGMRIEKQKEKSCSLEGVERVPHQSPVSCFMTPILIYHPLIHAEII
ncbi:hypothetical protein VPH35_044008 [Triticum aestivum]